jgi:hypothetical protein
MAKSAWVQDPNHGGKRYMRPSSFGYKWRRQEKLLDELESLIERLNKSSARSRELAEELEFQKNRNELEAIQALREGKEPPNEKYLRLTQDAIDQENKKYERLKHAAALVTRDIEEDLREHAEEYIAHAAEKARNESVQYNAHIQEAMRAKEAVEQANQVYVTITGDDFGRRFPSDAVNKRWDQTFGVCWIPDALEDQEAQDPVISSESAAALIG